jgi:hypothetical protein
MRAMIRESRAKGFIWVFPPVGVGKEFKKTDKGYK